MNNHLIPPSAAGCHAWWPQLRGIPPMAGGQGSALGPGSIPGAADWLVIPHKTDLLTGQRRRALASKIK